MKKKDLVKLISDIPEDAEIVIEGYSCNILGDYHFNSDLEIIEDVAIVENGVYKQEISRGARNGQGKAVKVYLIK